MNVYRHRQNDFDAHGRAVLTLGGLPTHGRVACSTVASGDGDQMTLVLRMARRMWRRGGSDGEDIRPPHHHTPPPPPPPTLPGANQTGVRRSRVTWLCQACVVLRI